MKTWIHGVKHDFPDNPAGHHCQKCKVPFGENSEAGILGSIKIVNDSLEIDWVYVCPDCAVEIAYFAEGA